MEAVTRQQREGRLNYTVYVAVLGLRVLNSEHLSTDQRCMFPVTANAAISHANEMLRRLLKAGETYR